MTTNSTVFKSPVIRESLWILAAILITLSTTYLFITLILGNGALDIHLHDTYLVIEGKWFFRVALPPLLFLICLARIILQRNCFTLAYWVALASGLITVIELSWLINFMNQTFPKTGMDLFVIGIQAIVVIALLWVAYQWGRRNQASQPISSPPPPSSSGRIP